MKIENVPFHTTDWSRVPATEHRGEVGTATWRTIELGNIRVRQVDYSAGYVADHWCERGHVVLALEGEPATPPTAAPGRHLPGRKRPAPHPTSPFAGALSPPCYPRPGAIRWFGFLDVLVLVLAVFGGAREAHAQGIGGPGGDALVPAIVGSLALELVPLIGGIVTGLSSASLVARGESHKGWFVSSYIAGTLNLVCAVAWAYYANASFSSTGNEAQGAFFATMAAMHAGIGVWNVIMPTIGFRREAEDHSPVSTVAPVVVHGRGVGGHRWSGLGVQIATF